MDLDLVPIPSLTWNRFDLGLSLIVCSSWDINWDANTIMPTRLLDSPNGVEFEPQKPGCMKEACIRVWTKPSRQIQSTGLARRVLG